MSYEEIEEQAAKWAARRDSDDWSAQEQAQLEEWLAQSTSHRVAYLRLQSVWRRADRLAALSQPSLAHAQPKPRKVIRRASYAVAASIALTAMVSVTVYVHSRGSTYSTGVGGRQTVPLADGSRLELNTRTSVRTEVDAESRTVWLDRGEAYFEIEHDATRPFVVHAGDRKVTVLGTKFSVRRDGDQLEVAVVEGRVQVDDARLLTSRPPAIVEGGDILLAQPSATLVATHAPAMVARELSWRQGLLIFENSTLAEAVAEFNRYNEVELVIADQHTGELRIGGVFEADAVDAFVRLLQRGFGLKVQRQGDEIRILR